MEGVESGWRKRLTEEALFGREDKKDFFQGISIKLGFFGAASPLV